MYKQAVEMFIKKPVLTPEELQQVREAAAARAQQGNSNNVTLNTQAFDAELRKSQLVLALASGTEKLKMEVKEKYKNMG